MAKATRRVGALGRVTIPHRLRERLGLEPGDLVELEVEPVEEEGER